MVGAEIPFIHSGLDHFMVNAQGSGKSRGVVVLGLLGLFGALAAGLMVDAMSPATSSGGADEGDSPPENDHNGTIGTHDIFADFTVDALADTDDGPVSSSSDHPPSLPGALITGTESADTLSSGAGDDTILGAGGHDQITARGGDDQLEGGAGNDNLWAGNGDDKLAGGIGNDTLYGGDGDDDLFGNDNDDWLYGEDGNDRIDGDAGHDSLLGGTGNDTLSGDAGDDWLHGGYGDDSLRGDTGADTLDGDFGNDTLDGRDDDNATSGHDFLNGGEGEDVLIGGAGDYLTGGQSADTFVTGDWITDGNVANISDYNAAEDQIHVIYDPAVHPDPHLTLRHEDNATDATIMLDGHPLALVQGGASLDLSSIRLMPDLAKAS